MPGLALTGFILQTFSILQYISTTTHEVIENKSIRKITEKVLSKHLNKVVNFACVNHEDWAVRFSVRGYIMSRN